LARGFSSTGTPISQQQARDEDVGTRIGVPGEWGEGLDLVYETTVDKIKSKRRLKEGGVFKSLTRGY
jgi:hypothetical protein